MATYAELRNLMNDAQLKNRVASAVIISAQTLIDGTPTAPENAWASKAFQNPENEARRALMYVLAANSDQPVATIQGASDAAIQTNVNSAVTAFVAADAGT